MLNEDIIDLENAIDVVLDKPYDYLNWALKDGLKENENFVLLDHLSLARSPHTPSSVSAYITQTSYHSLDTT